MAVKIDYAKTAKELTELAGGPENIDAVAHCVTRLRYNLRNPSRADKEKMKNVRGVLGVIEAGGQTQVVLGANVNGVYEEVLKQYHFDGQKEPVAPVKKEEKKNVKSVFKAIVDYVAAAVSPMVPALVAGGLMKVVLLLIGLASPAFRKSSTNQILGFIANAPFCFMPVFVAYGGAKKLNSTPAYAMMVSAALLTPEWVTLVSQLKDTGTAATSILGIPALAVTYSNSLLPALLITAVAAYLEKFFTRYIPGIFRSLLVGLCTVSITGILAFTVLGPAGDYAGKLIAQIFLFLGGRVAPVAIALLAAFLPWLIMLGMHHSISPFMASNIADIGYDAVIRPAFILHNMAEGGAALGVALRAKDPEFRSEAFSIAFGCIVAGVSEPCLYGITMKLKKPMYAVMTGGAAGGIITGLLHVQAYVMGYSTLLALPIFMDTIVSMLTAIVVAIIVSAVTAYLLGFDQSKAVN